MATRDEIYLKYGITAEAAQLFETELGTLLLGAKGITQGWLDTPDPNAGHKFMNRIDKYTLGRHLKHLKKLVSIDEEIEKVFADALTARNRLFHGFYEKHSFMINTDKGRSVMFADLEGLHTELFQAWQVAQRLTATMLSYTNRPRI